MQTLNGAAFEIVTAIKDNYWTGVLRARTTDTAHAARSEDGDYRINICSRLVDVFWSTQIVLIHSIELNGRD